MDLELLSSRPAVSAVPVTVETPPLSERLLTRRILILGSGPMAAKVVEEIEAVEGSRDVVAGLVDHEEPQVPWARNTKWLGPPSRLAEIVERVRPGRIVVAFAE